jgi:biopolymer transport protein ExbB
VKRDLVEATLHFLAEGGASMVPLVGCAALLWYVVGYRAFFLRRGSRLGVHTLAALEPAACPPGLLGDAARAALEVAGRGGRGLRQRLDAVLLPRADALDRGARLARALVSVSPLLGLLGTVTGMVTMFDGLGSGSGFDAGETAIARGIAEALHATELSLVVAVPGYFASRLLEGRAAQLRSELEQLRELLCARSPLRTGEVTA